MRRVLLALLSCVVVATACTPDPIITKKSKTGQGDDDDNTDPKENPGGDDDDAPPLGTPPSVPSTVPPTGSIALTLTADKGAASDDVVSFGLPFPQGVFKDAKNITVSDKSGKAVAISTKVLAKWPGDQSIRSVLVAFKASLASGASEEWKVEYGSAGKGGDAGALEANPNGPVIATLPADHYAASHVAGIILPRAKNQKWAAYETNLDQGAAAFNLSSFNALQCNGNASHRTYYDGPHARYMRGLRSGDPGQLRAAHDEANWYRANELQWVDAGKKIAITKCEAVESGQATWTPDARPLDWSTIRMMSGQGSLDDYLVTGDPAARQALAGLGEAYLQNLPLLEEGTLEITERNLGWPIMGLAAYYAIDQRAEVHDAAEKLVKRAIDWSARSPSGGLEHDIARPDPDECPEGSGPAGSSPFMTSLVVDGVMDWWLLTADPAVKPFMQKLGTWYETKAITSDKKAFRYLWGCQTNPYDTGDPDARTSPELNILIAHVFGAAYAVTKDKHWIDFGDTLVDPGIESMYVEMPKMWNQASRSFGKYLGYRALSGAAP